MEKEIIKIEDFTTNVKLKLTKSELKEIENVKGSDAPFFESEEKEEVEVVK